MTDALANFPSQRLNDSKLADFKSANNLKITVTKAERINLSFLLQHGENSKSIL
jgi:hypothetical protein